MKRHFLDELKLAGLPLPTCKEIAPHKELMFAKHLGREWRFDYAWENRKIALEVEGGTWIDGRHVRGSGFIADMSKYDAAALLGWVVIRVMPAWTTSGYAFRLIRAAFDGVITPELFPLEKKGKRRAA